MEVITKVNYDINLIIYGSYYKGKLQQEVCYL